MNDLKMTIKYVKPLKEFLIFHFYLSHNGFMNLTINLYNNYDKKIVKEETQKKRAASQKMNKKKFLFLDSLMLISEVELVNPATLNQIVQNTVIEKGK